MCSKSQYKHSRASVDELQANDSCSTCQFRCRRQQSDRSNLRLQPVSWADRSRALYLDFLLLACLTGLQIIFLFPTSLKNTQAASRFQKTNKATCRLVDSNIRIQLTKVQFFRRNQLMSITYFLNIYRNQSISPENVHPDNTHRNFNNSK